MMCERCNGSGQVGFDSATCTREKPGPVPDDSQGWSSATCPDCRGSGAINDERAETARPETKPRPISTRQAMLQVLAMRPKAKLVEGGIGWIVVDGDDQLNASAGGYVATPGEAWKHALAWLLFRYREGLKP